MVYGICYCPVEKLEELAALGVAGGGRGVPSGGGAGAPRGSQRGGSPRGVRVLSVGLGHGEGVGIPGGGGGGVSRGAGGVPGGGSLSPRCPPDSKTLSEGERERRFALLEAAGELLGWALQVLPPEHISACMQQR